MVEWLVNIAKFKAGDFDLPGCVCDPDILFSAWTGLLRTAVHESANGLGLVLWKGVLSSDLC
jgi:hypothetical protein